jgi:acetyl-CoA carboxylase biotin carboxyl carrier protein
MPSQKAEATPFDADLVRELASILNDTGLTEIEVERQGLKIRVAKTVTALASPVVAAPPPAGPAPAPASAAPELPAGEVVASPMVGTVYLQPQPGAPPFAVAGQAVEAGQTLLLVEAMKTMNPIVAPRAGVVREFLVGDGQPVEFGEPLVVLG